MPTKREVTDADGVWLVTTHNSGAESRVLIEPSQAYLNAREAERQAEQDRRKADAQARLDEFGAFEVDLENRKAALTLAALRAAITPIYDDMILRKRRELNIDEAEAILNGETR